MLNDQDDAFVEMLAQQPMGFGEPLEGCCIPWNLHSPMQKEIASETKPNAEAMAALEDASDAVQELTAQDTNASHAGSEDDGGNEQPFCLQRWDQSQFAEPPSPAPESQSPADEVRNHTPSPPPSIESQTDPADSDSGSHTESDTRDAAEAMCGLDEDQMSVSEYTLTNPDGTAYTYCTDYEGSTLPVMHYVEAKTWAWDVLANDSNHLWFDQTWFDQQTSSRLRGTRLLSYLRCEDPVQFKHVSGERRQNTKKRYREEDQVYQIQLTGDKAAFPKKNTCAGAKMVVRNPHRLGFLDFNGAPDVIWQTLDHACRSNASVAFQQHVMDDVFHKITDTSQIRMAAPNDIVPEGVTLHYHIMLPRLYTFNLTKVYERLRSCDHTSCEVQTIRNGSTVYNKLKITGLYGRQQQLLMYANGSLEFTSVLNSKKCREYTMQQTGIRIDQYRTQAEHVIAKICLNYKEVADCHRGASDAKKDKIKSNHQTKMSDRMQRNIYRLLHFRTGIADAHE